MIFGSIKTQQRKNIWESLSDLSRPDRQAVTLTATSWAGAGVFLSQRHLIMQGCVLAAGTEIHGWVCQLQGAQVQLGAKVTKLFYWESIQELCFSPHFLAVILNEELGALAQGLLVPDTERCPETGEHLRVPHCPLALIRYLGVWVTSESTRPVGEEDWGWERT